MNNYLDVSASVDSLVLKAAQAEKADDALKFSQAACNSANAMCALAAAKRQVSELEKPSGEPT